MYLKTFGSYGPQKREEKTYFSDLRYGVSAVSVVFVVCYCSKLQNHEMWHHSRLYIRHPTTDTSALWPGENESPGVMITEILGILCPTMVVKERPP